VTIASRFHSDQDRSTNRSLISIPFIALIGEVHQLSETHGIHLHGRIQRCVDPRYTECLIDWPAFRDSCRGGR
jgi:hypothetical protein